MCEGKQDTRRRIEISRLENQILRRVAGELSQRFASMTRVEREQYPFGSRNRFCAMHRLLHHRRVIDDRAKLFDPGAPAKFREKRLYSGTLTAGQNNTPQTAVA